MELFAGFDATSNLAIEVSYIDFGESSDGIPPEWHIEAETKTIAGLLKVPVNPQLDFYFKLGFHIWDWEFREDGIPGAFKEDGTDLFYGFGAMFEAVPNVKLGVRYAVYPIEVSGVDFDISQFSVNGAVSF